MIKLYSLPGCGFCMMLKSKLDKAGIEYETCQDTDAMEKLGIENVPAVQLEDGKLMGLSDVMEWLNKKN